MAIGKESTSFLVDSLKDSRVVGGIMFKSMDWPRTVLEEIHLKRFALLLRQASEQTNMDTLAT